MRVGDNVTDIERAVGVSTLCVGQKVVISITRSTSVTARIVRRFFFL